MGAPLSIERLETLFEQWSALDASGKREFLASLGPEERAAVEPFERAGADPEGAIETLRKRLHGAPPSSEALPMVAHFQLVSLIGEGGMSRVFMAHDTRLNRKTALKLTDLRTVRNYKEFLRESRIVALLEHDNICAIRSSGFTDENTGYLEMPMYQGASLRSVMLDSTPDGDRVRDMMRQVAAGLHAAHSAGVIHRDIKPENIFLESSGRYRILDFGVARLQSSVPSTAEGVLKGTIPYVSPETMTHPPAGPASDLWSLGVTAWEWMTGHQPFRGRSITHVMDAILQDNPPAPAGPDAGLGRIVLRCLEKDPAQRFPSAADLIAALDSP